MPANRAYRYLPSTICAKLPVLAGLIARKTYETVLNYSIFSVQVNGYVSVESDGFRALDKFYALN